VPGFFAQQTLCAACDATGFDSRVHRWVHSCTRGCQPRRYTGLNCSRACTDLLGEFNAGALALRVSLSPPSGSRPYYLHHVCGTAEALALASLPALRRGMWAYRLQSVAAERPQGWVFCGDAFLNDGEECDDGNAASGDGCDAACRVETDRYWDCDLVGAACLPDCGWPRLGGSASTASLWALSLSAYGYVLPACGVCRCDTLRYSDVQALPSLTERTHWMAERLVSCRCDGNPHRALPYAECTALNRGCRPCAAGEYHLDQYERCVACGAQCATGYERASTPPSECNSTVSTGALLRQTADEAARQRAVGCVPCATAPASGMRFVGNGTCAVACERGGSVATERYCLNEVDPVTGACPNARCMECATWLLSQTSTPVGRYPRGCADAYGYRWTECEGLPPHARWTRGTLRPNAARECAWECAACAWTAASHSACFPCGLKGKVACASGSRLIACAQLGCPNEDNYEVCVPCEGLPPLAMQVWTSDAPFYAQCLPDCEPGVSFASQRGDQCQACTRMTCALGTELLPCVPRADTTCRDCPLPRPADSEFVSAGSCEMRCVAGYYLDAASGGACVACATLECASGSRRSSECVAVEERLQAPTCVACGTAPPGMRWSGGCALACVAGFIPSASSSTNLSSGCVPCAPSLCGLGQQGVCLDAEARLVCVPCAGPPPAGARWAAAGDCAAVVCLEGYTLVAETAACVRPPSSSSVGAVGVQQATPSNKKNNNNNRGASTAGLPARSLRHS
jgi:cysteine-rich repeat protein